MFCGSKGRSVYPSSREETQSVCCRKIAFIAEPESRSVRWIYAQSIRKQTRELARELFVQGLGLAQIGRQLNVNPDTVSTWAKRHNWRQLRSQTCETLSQTGEKLASMTIAQQSARVRGQLATELLAQTALMSSTPLKDLKSLGNTPSGQGRSQIAKTIAETATRVFDWEAQQEPCVVAIGIISQLDADNTETEDENPPAV